MAIGPADDCLIRQNPIVQATIVSKPPERTCPAGWSNPGSWLPRGHSSQCDTVPNCGDSKRMCSYPRAVTDHPEVCAPLGVAVESSVGDGVGVAVGLGVGVTSGFWRAA